MLNNKEILITGTGTLGKQLVYSILSKYKPKGIRLLSRSEEPQRKFENELKSKGLLSNISFLIGDVRDRYRLIMATYGVDIIFHGAAMKQIDRCVTNPRECVYTNVLGSQNIIDVAIQNKVEKAILISSDKSTKPSTLYGASKMVAEQLFIDGNIYSGGRSPFLSCVRYGNILGSTGSVIPIFKEQYRKNKTITITDERMTRFWWTIEQAANFVISCVEMMKGGEIFVPKLNSCSVLDLAKMIVPEAKVEFTGIRANEKIDEELISIEESRNVEEFSDYLVIHPHSTGHKEFVYSSSNAIPLTQEKLIQMLSNA